MLPELRKKLKVTNNRKKLCKVNTSPASSATANLSSPSAFPPTGNIKNFSKKKFCIFIKPSVKDTIINNTSQIKNENNDLNKLSKYSFFSKAKKNFDLKNNSLKNKNT